MNEDNLQIDENTTCSNCLALTIRNEYRLKILANSVQLAKRISLKVSFAILLLNFLGMFL